MKYSRIDYIRGVINDDSFNGDLATITEEHKKRIKDALDKALDNRKFEIELYWKRTQYFWAFLVTIYGAYFAVSAKSYVIDDFQKQVTLLSLAVLGMFFTLAWHLANRGSKFWQQNWEYHVDELENYIYGPLYKTVIARTDNGKKILKGYWFSPVGAYPFSVSNLNSLLSFVIFITSWIVLGAEIYKFICCYAENHIVLTVGVVLSLIVMLMFSIYAEGQMAKEYIAAKDDTIQPVFFFRGRSR
jgi:hypothetical protein